jgi:hypothetical protein
MSEERPTQPGLELTGEDLAALRQRYTAQQVVACFQLLGLPVCDDPVIITQVAAREKRQREQESLSPDPALRQGAAAWLNANHLLEHPASRRELLLIVQEAINRMLAFRLERHSQAGDLYTPGIRADLKAAVIRGFALSDDLAERFLRAFEHGCNLRFGARIPAVLRSFDARAFAEQTFHSPLTTLIPPAPRAEAPATARQPRPQPTEPMRAIRSKPPVTKISAPTPPAGHRASGPLLTPGNTIARLLISYEDGQTGALELTKDATSIGRLPTSDLCLKEDRRVSRQHAVIHRAPTAFILTDLNSGNGTYLNGVLLNAPAVLHAGDIIRIGHTELTFTMEPAANQRNE